MSAAASVLSSQREQSHGDGNDDDDDDNNSDAEDGSGEETTLTGREEVNGSHKQFLASPFINDKFICSSSPHFKRRTTAMRSATRSRTGQVTETKKHLI